MQQNTLIPISQIVPCISVFHLSALAIFFHCFVYNQTKTKGEKSLVRQNIIIFKI